MIKRIKRKKKRRLLIPIRVPLENRNSLRFLKTQKESKEISLKTKLIKLKKPVTTSPKRKLDSRKRNHRQQKPKINLHKQKRDFSTTYLDQVKQNRQKNSLPNKPQKI